MKIKTNVILGLVWMSAVGVCAAGDVTFTIDATRDARAISPYIYGVNQKLKGGLERMGFERIGGNRWTTYNWVNNASNAGSDWHFENDDYLGGGNEPGGAVRGLIQNALDHGAGVLVTIPINGLVAADIRQDGDVRKSGGDYLRTRFVKELPSKPGAFSLHPTLDSGGSGGTVYEDEFVNWVKANFLSGRNAGRKIFFSLDNEPELWPSTHAEVHPEKLTYEELIGKSVAYGEAIKKVLPGTLVYGPVDYGWEGFVSLQDAPDARGRDFQEVYLQAMAAAEKKFGHRILDVMDVHWYTETKGAAARLQAPRSLWDPMYKEKSWIVDDVLHEPIRLIPRLREKIAKNYPGTKLSISEYNYGGGGDMTGAVAEADALGIFGREGLFSANQWPLDKDESFTLAAMRMYRDFDGKGGAFGGTSIFAQTEDVEGTSVYASVQGGVVTIVGINKTAAKISAHVRVENARGAKWGEVYSLSGKTAVIRDAGRIAAGGDFVVEMPGMSVNVVRLSGN